MIILLSRVLPCEGLKFVFVSIRLSEQSKNSSGATKFVNVSEVINASSYFTKCDQALGPFCRVFLGISFIKNKKFLHNFEANNISLCTVIENAYSIF